MPTGFQAVGDHGVMQVDASYQNFHFLSKGFMALTPEGGSTIHAGSVTISGQFPVLFIRPTSGAAGVVTVTRSGGSHTFTVAGEPQTLEWFSFDLSPSQGAGPGMVIYKEDGSVAFNSMRHPLRLVDVSKLPETYLDLTYGRRFSGPAGKYAVCLSEGRRQHTPQGNRVSVLAIECALVGSSYVDTKGVVYRNFPAPHAGRTLGGQILVADVSGL